MHKDYQLKSDFVPNYSEHFNGYSPTLFLMEFQVYIISQNTISITIFYKAYTYVMTKIFRGWGSMMHIVDAQAN